MFANPNIAAFVSHLVGGETPRGGAPPSTPSYQGSLAASLLGNLTKPVRRGNISIPAIEASRRAVQGPAQSSGVGHSVGSQDVSNLSGGSSSGGTGSAALAAGIGAIGQSIEGAINTIVAKKQASDQLDALRGSFPQFGGGVSGSAPAGLTVSDSGMPPAFARHPGVGSGTPETAPGDYLAKVAGIENPSGSPYATSSTGATGKFQFIPSTWRQFGAGGNIHDPSAQDAAMNRFTRANYATLQEGLGRAPTDGELYLAHQQGAAGALKLLQNPNMPAGQLVGARAISVNGGNPNAPAASFVDKWGRRFGGAQTYGDQIQDRQQDAAPLALGPQSMMMQPQISPLAMALAAGQIPPIDPNFGGAGGLFG